MLTFHAWRKWQTGPIYDRLRKRTPGGRGKPVVLSYVAVATNMDDESGNFRRFAGMVGGGIVARGYLVMILGWIGRNAAATGTLRCSRDELGPGVLTDVMGSVSRTQGARIYDALIASGIASEVDADDVTSIPPSSVDPAGSAAGKAAGDPPGTAAGNAPGHDLRKAPSPGPESGPPHAPGRGASVIPGAVVCASRARGHDARAASNSPDPAGKTPGPTAGDPARAEELSGDESPLAPRGRGESEGLSAEHHDTPPRPLRPRVRERWHRVLDYVVRAGRTQDEMRAARALRDRGDDVPDAEVVAHLEGAFAWVTPERLARSLDTGGQRRDDEPGATVTNAAPQATTSVTSATPTCPRHGRAAPCSVCETLATPPADPAVVAARVAEMRSKLGKRTAAAAPAVPAPTMPETERAAIRAGGELGAMPASDPRRAAADALLAEPVRDAAWVVRARGLLAQGVPEEGGDDDLLAAFGGAA